MLKMKRISETYDMKVFTDTGEYFGDIEESILTTNDGDNIRNHGKDLCT